MLGLAPTVNTERSCLDTFITRSNPCAITIDRIDISIQILSKYRRVFLIIFQKYERVIFFLEYYTKHLKYA